MIRQTYILGSGRPANKQPYHVYVDYRPFPGVDVVIDLEKTPWPIKDGAAKHVNATHLIEHLSNFPAFMDECWRILNPGGSLFFEVPVIQLNQKAIDLVFADPTHKRFFRKHTFINYLTVEGVEQHAVVEHAWCPVHLEEKEGGFLRGHLFAVPDEARTAETIAMWKEYKEKYSHVK